MQLTITIPDEFAALAEARGFTPERYLQTLVAAQSAGQQFTDPSALSADEFNQALDALTRYSEKIPSLPVEAFSRASFYENHD